MFFQYTDVLSEISPEEIDENILTAGYVKGSELAGLCNKLGFADSAAEACASANKHFRSGVEVYDDCTFTELRIIDENDEDDDDCVAMFVKKNLLLIVDVEDRDGSTKAKFTSAVRRFAPGSATLEKLIFAFLDTLLSGFITVIEDTENQLSGLEEQLLGSDVEKDFNAKLFEIKTQMLHFRVYFEQIIDITEVLDEDENDIFGDTSLMYINNIDKRLERLKEDTNSIKSTVEHLQGTYNSYLDSKLNNTMKIFTVLTSIFFPLTIIVGWYGMNFQSMPEFTWKYGYIYVIALSVVTVAVLTIIGKRKKWF